MIISIYYIINNIYLLDLCVLDLELDLDLRVLVLDLVLDLRVLERREFTPYLYPPFRVLLLPPTPKAANPMVSSSSSSVPSPPGPPVPGPVPGPPVPGPPVPGPPVPGPIGGFLSIIVSI